MNFRNKSHVSASLAMFTATVIHKRSAASSLVRRLSHIVISPEVIQAVKQGRPVIALESTILTHGLPAEQALNVAHQLDQLTRAAGVIPATVGLLHGRLIVGMSLSEQQALITEPGTGKAALRDIPAILAGATQCKNFGTTVSATLFGADHAGIAVFATGGIGGVHRGANDTWDVSSDLVALSRFPLAVICAGVKSILDIGKTLEMLETLSVPVVVHGSQEFPAFFTSRSGFAAPCRVDQAEQVAKMLKFNRGLATAGGLLVAVPHTDHDQQGEEIDEAIKQAVDECKTTIGLSGAQVTPFILERVRQLTGDKSLEANASLIVNNVRYACELADRFCELDSRTKHNESRHCKIVICGGSNIDHTIKIAQENIQVTADLYPPGSFLGQVPSLTPGGVGRNMADVLSKLGVKEFTFLTALAEKERQEGSLLQGIPSVLAPVTSRDRTACYVGVFNKSNELMFGVADMDIHARISPSFVKDNLVRLKPSVVMLDANLSHETIECILEYCCQPEVMAKAWIEPTDHHKVMKALYIIKEKPQLGPLELISPNEFELQKILAWKCGKKRDIHQFSIQELAQLIRASLLDIAENYLVKRGHRGIIFVNAHEAFQISSPIQSSQEIKSVSGAGDSLIATILYARYHLNESDWKRCLLYGLRAAEASMRSDKTVPESLSQLDQSLDKWAKKLIITKI